MKDKLEKKKIVEDIRKEIEISKGTRIWTDYVNALKLISQVVFTRSSGFILELMQNAEDAGLDLEYPGIFEIRLDQARVKIMHNGNPFTGEDVKALCGIRSSKKPERGTLGYLGIGFKSIFKITDCPQVYSDGFQLKFDRNYREWVDPSNTPWHVIPIWLDKPSETVEPEKTTFIMPYREESYYRGLLVEIEKFKTEVYLFLRWLKKIQIVDEVSGRRWTLENLGEDGDGITILKQNSEEQRFKFFRRVIKVPEWVKQDRLTQEYRANVNKREIAIAFAIDGEGNLAPLEAGAMYGGVYSFLPLGEARSGAKFPIQADFLVQPGRDAINCEAKWNHWLVEEVTTLCKESIDFFKKHEKWKYQFLPAFDFTKSEGLESYDKLFGPKLIGPVERFLEEDNCILTIDGGWAKPKEVVRITEASDARKALVVMGVLKEEEIAPIMSGEPNLKLIHPDVLESESKPIKKVNRWDLLKNHDFLENKSKKTDAGNWFNALYNWLNKHPIYEEYFYRKWRRNLKTYHEFEFILTDDRRLLKGGEVYLLDISTTDPLIKDLTRELKSSKPILNYKILKGVRSEEERKDLRGFLTGLTGVQLLDINTVCKEALLRKILTSSPKPSPKELLKYTIYCQQILGNAVGDSLEFWILTKQGKVRAAKEVLFPKEFKPEQDWETYQQYVSGINFISKRYIADITSDDQLRAWRQFFKAGGVKDAPVNGVEEFAMKYAEEKLKSYYKNVTCVDKRKFGYDIEAEIHTDEKIYIEVKGQSYDQDVVLEDNELVAADTYKGFYYLCVVSCIPENPAIYMIQDPARVGKKDKLTIPVDIWKVPWP